MQNRKGFTLVELLIVIAVLGVLASIAITQFAAYRQKGYNSAATNDLKNGKTILESFYAENHTYP